VVQLRRKLLQDIRPDAISLVDAWAFTDYELNSALGREDGDVYNALLAAAKASPLNETDEGPAWSQVLQPAMQQLREMRAKL
jgi:acyl-CoA oxidase